MIASLRGTVIDLAADSLTIEVSGIGYEVKTTPRVLQAARIGAEIALQTHLQVKEDSHILFGFSDSQERTMFRTLLTVSGVGPKTALNILSVAQPMDIVRAVQSDDTAALKAPGVGPKIVKRVISELKSVFGDMVIPAAVGGVGQPSVPTDLTQALEHLGYTTVEIREMLREVSIDGMSVEQALTVILRRRR